MEGEVEEPSYFRRLEQLDIIDERRVRLIVLPPQHGESSPRAAVERMEQFVTDARPRPFDPCWLVVDVDRHKTLHEALTDARGRSWQVAVSHPCFEVWLQLHHTDEPQGETSGDAKRAWRALRESLRNELRDQPVTTESVRRATVRSEARDNGHDVPLVCASHVHRLVKDLIRSTEQPLTKS